MLLSRDITYFGQPAVVACDGLCIKAWGSNTRPKVQIDPADEDDYYYVPDGELGLAPGDPGTYEGADGKPQHESERLNKWCVRECERSRMGPSLQEILPLSDFSRRVYNCHWRNEAAAEEEGC